MKPDTYKLIQMCVETGTARGLRRAYKHDESPTTEQIEDKVVTSVMHEICEWFKFEPVGEE